MGRAGLRRLKGRAQLAGPVTDRWYEERRREQYYRKAKREGYRARSAYKLKQLHAKFDVVRPGDAAADLGCAPGGWSQVLVELVGPEGVVIGVDLQRTRPLEGAQLVQGDFTHAETQQRMEALLRDAGRGSFDLVVSDMAPDMTGHYDLDQTRSVHLSLLAVAFARRNLRVGGALVCKVFEGADFQEFRDDIRSSFRAVKTFHPPASRKQSSEVYIVAKGFLGDQHDDSEE